MKAPGALTWRTASEILEKVERAKAHVSNELARASRNPRLNFPLLERLVKGTLSARSVLDRELSRELKTSVDSIPPYERQVARLAAFELTNRESTERAATIAMARDLLSRSPHDQLTRALMTALNRLSPIRTTRSAGVSTGSSPAAMAEELGYPEWLFQRWVSQFGLADTVAFAKACNSPWGVHVRCNTLKTTPKKLKAVLTAEGVTVEEGRFDPSSFYIRRLPRGKRLSELSTFRRGLFQVQDESASLVGRLMQPQPEEFIVDLCAAPGGKATHLADLMKDLGQVLAVDTDAKRLAKVRENCKRLGIRSVRTLAKDASALTLPSPADRVLLDAPCSGFGVMGRKSDIRWNKREKDIKNLTKLQSKLLNHAATLVRPGGILVYSTCTIEKDENEGRVEEFLAAHPNFELLPPPKGFPEELTSGSYFRSWPHRHGIGGAFGAVLKRRE